MGNLLDIAKEEQHQPYYLLLSDEPPVVIKVENQLLTIEYHRSIVYSTKLKTTTHANTVIEEMQKNVQEIVERREKRK
jgi:hypothetical protein